MHAIVDVLGCKGHTVERAPPMHVMCCWVSLSIYIAEKYCLGHCKSPHIRLQNSAGGWHTSLPLHLPWSFIIKCYLPKCLPCLLISNPSSHLSSQTHTIDVTMNSWKHGNLVLTSVTSAFQPIQIENWLDLHKNGVCIHTAVSQWN